jgi:hypothetical protein
VAVVGQARYEWTTEAAYAEIATVAIHCWALGAAAAEDVAALLHAAFDWKPLPFVSTTSIYCRPLDYRVSNSFVRYQAGDVLYDVESSYEVAVNRTLS